MQSLWQDTVKMPRFLQQEKDLKTDVLIVGGGLTGLLCAYFLKSAGVDCLLSESDTICAHTSGHTTAKITVQHGCCYQKILADYGKTGAQQYLNANRSALAAYRQICTGIDCDFEEKDAVIYAYHEEEQQTLKAEENAYKLLGMPVQKSACEALPFPTLDALVLPRQAQFHPLKFAAAIAKDLPILEHTRVKKFDKTTAFTEHGRIFAKKVIIASHFPFINTHGLYFMKQYQYRSYVLALENAQDVGAMYISAFSDGLSLRNWGDILLLGGRGHKTGKKSGGFAELWAFASSHYPGCRIRESWATQDCMTPDDIPYIGEYARSLSNFYVATGFNKWGMTSAMAAAQILTDKIIGRESPNAAVFSPIGRKFKVQILVNAFTSVGNLLCPLPHRCSHLGCALRYNKAEHSWDCPCHGSRFSKKGKILDGPANRPL